MRDRLTTLKVNYRTSEQIRTVADRLLPPLVRDVDGTEGDRRGTVSVFAGPPPAVVLTRDVAAERDAVATLVTYNVEEGVSPGEMAVFVRSRAELPRAAAAIAQAGLPSLELSERRSTRAIKSPLAPCISPRGSSSRPSR